MKKLLLMGAFLFSFGAFAQSGVQSIDSKSSFSEFEKQGYVQVDANTAYNSQFDCYIGIIRACDEIGMPVGITVTSHTPAGIAAKQQEYCETGTIKVLKDC